MSEGRISVFEWQKKALAAWRKRRHCGVVEAVTGAGKTMVGLLAAQEALKEGRKVIVVVPTIELQEQWIRSIRSAMPWSAAGRLGGGGDDSLSTCDVLVGVVHSVAKASHAASRVRLVFGRGGLLIADECHRYAADAFSAALSDSLDWRLGLTATYAREDGRDVTVLDEYFGGIVYQLWYDQALQERVIAEFDIALVAVELSPDQRADYDHLSERIRETRRSLSGYVHEKSENRESVSFRVFLKLVTAWSAEQDESPRRTLARRYVALLAQRRHLLADARCKVEALNALAPGVAAAQGTLVFTQTKEAAERAVERLSDCGQRAVAVYSGVSRSDRVEGLRRFRDREVNVLAAPRVLDEGIDVPEADLGIVLAANRSRRQMVQRLGRVIRRKADGRQGRFVVLYARDTVEDPHVAGDEHLNDVLQYTRRLLMCSDAHDPALAEFLARPSEDVEGQRAFPPNTVSDPDLDRTARIAEEIWADAEPSEQLSDVPLTADIVHDYLQRIAHFPLIDGDEEKRLGKLREAGDAAESALTEGIYATRMERRRLERARRVGQRSSEQLFTANLRLVVSIAKRYVGGTKPGIDFMDIIHEGNIGLMRAVQKFDAGMGNKFSTYATWWIRQGITRALADQSRTIRLPVHMVEKLSRIRASLRTLECSVSEEDGRLEPSLAQRVREGTATHDETVDALAASTESTADELAETMGYDYSVISLDSPVWLKDGDRVFLGAISDTMKSSSEPLYAALLRADLRFCAQRLLSTVPRRDAKIISARFGFLTGEEMTYDAIGALVGLTRERVRQIINKYLATWRRESQSMQDESLVRIRHEMRIAHVATVRHGDDVSFAEPACR
ncbi:sigma-70 family RNA polymerase sigma factor [Pseudoclavibacter sp. 13-3]|uniref:sigma-70 family RNA polymerase sigma factor n=1 Tax=Pseudoclavibacter sp. 13-3 TaxID=2901228 RepID=UPI001E3FDA35|nr:sigma-70 family RNA polymerase sigma factor [Pseudoclavibacter sp. 13-3]MCD7100713.1 sigma-70 family RNA polymerase sigma factor [Pseudoclavibacter sp. 13-3]